ncbi:MAG: hypothetical protein J6M53_05175 [Bacteroidaceae bacterium]|nr:hypothetical protein [Bacteroidaceae bacterium]
MTTVAMNNLWTFILGMNLTARNEDWLTARLLERRDARKAKALNNLDQAFKEFRQVQEGTVERINAEDLLNEL